MSLTPTSPFQHAFQELSDNERLVLQLLRRMGSGSKAELARNTHLTSAAVGSIVKKLEKKGLILPGERVHAGQRGQPATRMHLNPTGAYGIGIRLERNFLQSVLVDFDGNIISQFTREMLLPHPEEALSIVSADIENLLPILNKQTAPCLAGIGLATPFNLGSWLNELDLPKENFAPWESCVFASDLEKTFTIPVISENDATAAAIAELFYGIGRHRDDFLSVHFGPAIGGGLVLKGDIVRGSRGNAADLGLMPVPASRLASSPLPKGKWDILLNRASLNSLRRHLKSETVPDSTLSSRKQLEMKVDQGGPAVLEWFEDCLEALVPTILAATAMLDVPTIVLGANIGGSFVHSLCSRLEESLHENMPEARVIPEIVASTYGSDAAAIGAASLPMFYSFSPRKPLLASSETG